MSMTVDMDTITKSLTQTQRRPNLHVVVMYANDTPVLHYAQEVAQEFSQHGVDIFFNTDAFEVLPSDSPCLDQTESPEYIAPKHLSPIILASPADCLIVIGDKNMHNHTVQACDSERSRLIEVPVHARLISFLTWIYCPYLLFDPYPPTQLPEYHNYSESEFSAVLAIVTGKIRLYERVKQLQQILSNLEDAGVGVSNGKQLSANQRFSNNLLSQLTRAQTSAVQLHQDIQIARHRLLEYFILEDVVQRIHGQWINFAQIQGPTISQFCPEISLIPFEVKEYVAEALDTLSDNVNTCGTFLGRVAGPKSLWSSYLEQEQTQLSNKDTYNDTNTEVQSPWISPTKNHTKQHLYTKNETNSDISFKNSDSTEQNDSNHISKSMTNIPTNSHTSSNDAQIQLRPGQWSCDVCTFINEQTVEICTMCSTRRPLSLSDDSGWQATDQKSRKSRRQKSKKNHTNSIPIHPLPQRNQVQSSQQNTQEETISSLQIKASTNTNSNTLNSSSESNMLLGNHTMSVTPIVSNQNSSTVSSDTNSTNNVWGRSSMKVLHPSENKSVSSRNIVKNEPTLKSSDKTRSSSSTSSFTRIQSDNSIGGPNDTIQRNSIPLSKQTIQTGNPQQTKHRVQNVWSQRFTPQVQQSNSQMDVSPVKQTSNQVNKQISETQAKRSTGERTMATIIAAAHSKSSTNHITPHEFPTLGSKKKKPILPTAMDLKNDLTENTLDTTLNKMEKKMEKSTFSLQKNKKHGKPSNRTEIQTITSKLSQSSLEQSILTEKNETTTLQSSFNTIKSHQTTNAHPTTNAHLTTNTQRKDQDNGMKHVSTNKSPSKIVQVAPLLFDEDAVEQSTDTMQQSTDTMKQSTDTMKQSTDTMKQSTDTMKQSFSSSEQSTTNSVWNLNSIHQDAETLIHHTVDSVWKTTSTNIPTTKSQFSATAATFKFDKNSLNSNNTPTVDFFDTNQDIGSSSFLSQTQTIQETSSNPLVSGLGGGGGDDTSNEVSLGSTLNLSPFSHDMNFNGMQFGNTCLSPMNDNTTKGTASGFVSPTVFDSTLSLSTNTFGATFGSEQYDTQNHHDLANRFNNDALESLNTNPFTTSQSQTIDIASFPENTSHLDDLTTISSYPSNAMDTTWNNVLSVPVSSTSTPVFGNPDVLAMQSTGFPSNFQSSNTYTPHLQSDIDTLSETRTYEQSTFSDHFSLQTKHDSTENNKVSHYDTTLNTDNNNTIQDSDMRHVSHNDLMANTDTTTTEDISGLGGNLDMSFLSFSPSVDLSSVLGGSL